MCFLFDFLFLYFENRFFKNIHIGLQKNPICIYFTYRIAEKSHMYLFYIWDFEAFMHTNDCEIQ